MLYTYNFDDQNFYTLDGFFFLDLYPVTQTAGFFIKTALGSLDDCRRHTFHSFIKTCQETEQSLL